MVERLETEIEEYERETGREPLTGQNTVLFVMISTLVIAAQSD